MSAWSGIDYTTEADGSNIDVARRDEQCRQRQPHPRGRGGRAWRRRASAGPISAHREHRRRDRRPRRGDRRARRGRSHQRQPDRQRRRRGHLGAFRRDQGRVGQRRRRPHHALWRSDAGERPLDVRDQSQRQYPAPGRGGLPDRHLSDVGVRGSVPVRPGRARLHQSGQRLLDRCDRGPQQRVRRRHNHFGDGASHWRRE